MTGIGGATLVLSYLTSFILRHENPGKWRSFGFARQILRRLGRIIIFPLIFFLSRTPAKFIEAGTIWLDSIFNLATMATSDPTGQDCG